MTNERKKYPAHIALTCGSFPGLSSFFFLRTRCQHGRERARPGTEWIRPGARLRPASAPARAYRIGPASSAPVCHPSRGLQAMTPTDRTDTTDPTCLTCGFGFSERMTEPRHNPDRIRRRSRRPNSVGVLSGLSQALADGTSAGHRVVSVVSVLSDPPTRKRVNP